VLDKRAVLLLLQVKNAVPWDFEMSIDRCYIIETRIKAGMNELERSISVCCIARYMVIELVQVRGQ
jgi:hypothetical protein